MKTKLSIQFALIALVCLLAGSFARAGELSRRIDVPAGDIVTALESLAKQTDVELVFQAEALKGIRTSGVRGTYAPREAVALLLKGTNLALHTDSSGAMFISQAASEPAAMNTDGAPPTTLPPAVGSDDGAAGLMRLAQGTGSAPAASAPAEPSDGVQEIIVTAQKRAERLQEVPVPVTALDAATLVQNNQLRLQDYFAKVPGLNFQAGGRNGEPQVSIRGINSTQNPTVGVTVDDVASGSSVFRGGGFIAPDIDPTDLARIEVLRGPQGTLYGANSIGGLIKYVTVDPSTERVSGDIGTGITHSSNGGDMGYSVRGSLNIPLSDTAAVRASAFTREEPGYIDNTQNGARDINSGDAMGGMIAALYRPSDAFSLKVSALMQERNSDGAALANPALGDLRQNTLVATGWTERRIEAYTANLSGRLGDAELTSLTGYNRTQFDDSVDLSALFGPSANTYFGVTGSPYNEYFEVKKFSQELRLVKPLGERFELLVGGFYTTESFDFDTYEYAANSSTGAIVGTLALFDGRGGYEEYAAFADLTVRFTDRFDIQFGGRSAHNKQHYSEVDTGPLAPGGGLIIPRSEITDDPLTFLVTPRWRISPDLMVYSRLASGYRAGGINLAAARGYPVPAGYGSDTTYNYEIGVKGNVLNGAVTFDASVFYIDWKDLQVSFNYAPGINFQDNASRAKSQGVELSVESQPWQGGTVSASAVYNEAQLSEGFGTSTTRGSPGDRLPFSSELAGSLSVDQRIALSESWDGFIGASVAYVGDRIGLFRTNPVRQQYPSYTQLDARAGVQFQSWKVSIFGTNLTDKRGLVGGGLGQTLPTLFNYIQPRTIGLTASKTF